MGDARPCRRTRQAFFGTDPLRAFAASVRDQLRRRARSFNAISPNYVLNSMAHGGWTRLWRALIASKGQRGSHLRVAT